MPPGLPAEVGGRVVLVTVAAPFADVRAADLALVLDGPPLPALEVLRVDVDGWELELRLLGHSHQAVVRDGAFALSEAVACRPGRSGVLPARRELRRGDRAYAFAAERRRLAPAAYAAAVAALRAALAPDPRALLGVFPGPADAVTGLRARPTSRGVRWETWHGYPPAGELVATRSEVRR
jgi:hypothetical protein